MKYRIIILFFTLFGFLSCKHTNNLEINKKGLRFDIGFESRSKFEGTIYNKISQNTSFYFADPVTEKKVIFFDIDGRKTDSISLSKGLKIIQHIEDIVIISKDSVLLSNKYNGNIVLVDSQGEIIQNVFLDQYDQYGNYYEYNFSFIGNNSYQQKTMLMALSWYGNKNELENNTPSPLEQAKNYYTRFAQAPYFMKVESLFCNKPPKQTYYLSNFYNQFVDESSVMVEGKLYHVTDNKVFVFSSFSKDLYVYNWDNFSFIKKIQIIPNEESVAKPPILDEHTISDIQESLNKELQTKSIISNIGYMRNKEKYIVVRRKYIFQSNINTGPNLEILVFDKNLEGKETFSFEGNKYHWYGSFITEDGIMLLQNNEKNKQYGVKIYDLFEI
jgi:hypothetical protein